MFAGFSELVAEFAIEFLSNDMKKNQESASLIAQLAEQSKKNESYVEENADATRNGDSDSSAEG